MIRYDLRCAQHHHFEAWFRDSAAFDALRAAGAVVCATCGCAEVEKQLMAPALGRSARREAVRATDRPEDKPQTRPEATSSEPGGRALFGPTDSAAGRALAALRAHLEATAEHVGPRFASEARRIHLGEAEQRPIWGEATAQEARALAEEGVPAAPLPFLPRRDD